MTPKQCGIILPRHFKTYAKFKQVHKRIRKLGYRSISEYFYVKCFIGTRTSGGKLAKELKVSDMTIYHKRRVMVVNTSSPLKPKTDLARHIGDDQVHWKFQCGCEYKGVRYRIRNKRVCKEHGNTLSEEYKVCGCGKTFTVGPRQGAKYLCEECVIRCRKEVREQIAARRKLVGRKRRVKAKTYPDHHTVVGRPFMSNRL